MMMFKSRRKVVGFPIRLQNYLSLPGQTPLLGRSVSRRSRGWVFLAVAERPQASNISWPFTCEPSSGTGDQGKRSSWARRPPPSPSRKQRLTLHGQTQYDGHGKSGTISGHSELHLLPKPELTPAQKYLLKGAYS